MTDNLNLDDFYKDAARTLVTLYQVFPRPVALYVEDISGPDEPDEYGVHSHRHQACFATFLWLSEEGYIRFVDTIRQEAIDQAVLTGRCFSALLRPVQPDPTVQGLESSDSSELPPSVSRERQTQAYQLSQAIKMRSAHVLREALLPLIEQMAN